MVSIVEHICQMKTSHTENGESSNALTMLKFRADISVRCYLGTSWQNFHLPWINGLEAALLHTEWSKSEERKTDITY